jgi:hypothetical protein
LSQTNRVTFTVTPPFTGWIALKSGDVDHTFFFFENASSGELEDFGQDLSHIDICVEESDGNDGNGGNGGNGDPSGNGGNGGYPNGGDGNGADDFPRKGVEAGFGGSGSDGSSALPLVLGAGARHSRGECWRAGAASRGS